MSVTERFTERWQLLGKINPSSSSAEQNSGWFSVANFPRVVVILQVGATAGTATVDMDIEIGTTSSGGTTATMTSKSITQLTDADDNLVCVVEIRGEEFIQSNVEYGYMQVELTSANAASLSAVTVWGYCDYAPAVVTGLEEVVD